MHQPIPLHVLIVDDETVVRDVLARFASHLGYRVVTAAGGAEAVARCRECAPAAVVLDVRMPELDGPTTLDAIRAVLPDLPCVFVSGDPRPYSVAELLARERTAFLNKPVGLNQLRGALAGLLSAAGPSA